MILSFVPDTSPTISGMVVDEKDAPVAGATVLYDLAESHEFFAERVGGFGGHFCEFGDSRAGRR